MDFTLFFILYFRQTLMQQLKLCCPLKQIIRQLLVKNGNQGNMWPTLLVNQQLVRPLVVEMLTRSMRRLLPRATQ